MALESVLDETPSAGGGGLVIWLDYATLLETGEWFVDYNTDVHNLDTDQTDALDYLFKTKKGWEGTGADQYQALYDVFLEEIYRPFFENKLLSIKNTTMDAITGACKLMNLCDDFHLAFDSDDYQAEIRFGRHGGGQLMYDSTYKNTIITYCEDVSTATDEEDELLEEAIAAVSDLHYPQFAIGINIVKGRKEFFIKKQKRIDNYKETFTDYTERVVQFDQDVADAYNAEVNENVKAAYDYVPLKEVEPWEVDCANQWVATGDFQSMIDFIRSSPKDARTWTDGRAEAITIIYINAYEGKNVDVLNTFYDQFCITFFQKSYKKWETVWIEAEGINEATEQEITYDDYIVKVDPAVVDRMDDYMDKYAYPEAWTALTQEYHVSVGYTDEDRSDRVTCISVSQGEGGKLVTEVSIKNANGDTLSSVAVAEHNVFDDTYGNGVVPALRDAGLNEEQIDAYLEGEDGLRLKAHNPYYQMTDYEEKKAEELVEKHWEEHPEEKEYIKYASSYMDHGRNSGMTFDEWYTYWTGNEFDQETFEQAKYYYEIEHKTSEWDAFWDGFTKTGYNIEKVVDKVGDNCADKINDVLHLDDLFVPDEHDLKMKEFNEEMEQMREWERTASQTQNPGWYTAGHIAERFTTTAIASAAFGGAEVAGAVAEKVGGGILTEYAVTVACDTVVDTVVDTIPEMINNTCDGMDKEEVWDRAKDNFLGNLGINALTAGAGTAFKMAGEAGDGLKTAENGADAIKAVDNASDTAKAIAGNADTLKAVGNAADSAKAVGNSMDSVKAAANSTDVAKAAANSSDITKAASNASDTAKSVAKSSDTVKTVANSADAAKATSNAVDTTRAAANSADTAKAASNSIDTAKVTANSADTAKVVSDTVDSVKVAEKSADAVKSASDSVDTVKKVTNSSDEVKVADHVTDTTKVADEVTDAEKVADHATDSINTVDQAADTAKTADYMTDATKAADQATDVVKTADHMADATKAADQAVEAAKTADHAVDATKVADQATDSVKTADHMADATKAADEAADVAKTADHMTDATKAADEAAEAAKAADHMTDATKAADEAAEAAKTADHMADATKAADEVADTAKTADYMADATKAADEAAKTADHMTDVTKAADESADTVKIADQFGDTAKATEHTTDTVKEAEHAYDVTKTTENLAETEDAVEISTETARAVDDSEDIVREADHASEPNTHTEKNIAGDQNELANSDGSLLYEDGSRKRFKYQHNPSDNPKVLQNAIEDPNTVYGYRPRSDGSLASFATSKYNWDDPVEVAKYRKMRIAYHMKNEGGAQLIVSKMTKKGATKEEIARAVCDFRNQSRINAYIDENGNIFDVNGYRNALHRAEVRSYDNLIKRKTPEEIIKSATKGDPAMDACCGLYDEYYHTYYID